MSISANTHTLDRKNVSSKLLIVAIRAYWFHIFHRLPTSRKMMKNVTPPDLDLRAPLPCWQPQWSHVVTVKATIQLFHHPSSSHCGSKSQKIASATTCCWAKTWEHKIQPTAMVSGEKQNSSWDTVCNQARLRILETPQPTSMRVWVIMLLHFPILETL